MEKTQQICIEHKKKKEKKNHALCSGWAIVVGDLNVSAKISWLYTACHLMIIYYTVTLHRTVIFVSKLVHLTLSRVNNVMG